MAEAEKRVLVMAKKTAKKPSRPNAGGKAVAAPRLHERYEKEMLPGLAEKLGRTNRHSLPRLQKIVVNMGVGSAITEKKHMEDAVAALAADRRPKGRWSPSSRKAIANFSLREEHADRLQGDAPRHADVRIPRSVDFAGAAAGARLPRARIPTPSTATATTAWACRNNWCFRN